MLEDVFFIFTGGTIDAKPYAPPHTAENPPPLVENYEKSRVPQVLEECCGVVLDPRQSVQMKAKDSNLFTNDDMAAIADLVWQRRERHIVITHGTDKMPENARRLSAFLKDRQLTGKAVVFTGAMVPLSMTYSDGREGDGLSNLKYLIGRLGEKNIPDGIWIADKGELMNPARLVKDKAGKRFVEHLLYMR